MHRALASRRMFLLAGLAATCGAALGGCDGGSGKDATVTKQEDPSIKAKESMDYYKNNMGKGAAKTK